MEKRRPISYSFEDIKRYKQGLMNREEMHAFEKASMEDPFLADSLEGYLETDLAVAETHLAEIRENVSHRKEEKEKALVVNMRQKRFGLMRVAAMIIVIAGAGLITYKVFDNKEVTPSGGTIAKTEADQYKPGTGKAAAPPVSIDSASFSKTENTASNGDMAKSKDATVNQNPEGQLASAEIKNKENVFNGNSDNAASTPLNTKDKETSKAAVPATSSPVAVNKTVTEETTTNTRNRGLAREQVAVNEFRGKVLSPDNQPLANANIQVDNSRKAFVTDDEGNFRLDAKDTVITATVASSGYMNTRVQLRSNSENTINIGNIVLQPDPTVESTIAVTGLGVTKKEKVADTLSTKPEGGWESFQQYVANKLNTKVDTTGGVMKASGEMELEFFVDANGVPKDFRILNSTNAILSEQAIEAIKQGPKWATRKKKARILIRY